MLSCYHVTSILDTIPKNVKESFCANAKVLIDSNTLILSVYVFISLRDVFWKYSIQPKVCH